MGGRECLPLAPRPTFDGASAPPSGRRTPASVARIRVRGRGHRLPHRAGAAHRGVENDSGQNPDDRHRQDRDRGGLQRPEDDGQSEARTDGLSRTCIARTGKLPGTAKELELKQVKALVLSHINDNENIAACGLRLTKSQLQEVEQRQLKTTGKDKEEVTYASPEECRKWLEQRVEMARTVPEVLRIWFEAMASVVHADEDELPQGKRVYRGLPNTFVFREVMKKELKAIRPRRRRMPHTPEVMQVELASLVYLLGGMAAKHLVVIGGLVPPLLVPRAPSPHRGSADIDLSLSMAITKGETSEYYRSLEAAIEPYFEPVADSGFRWRKRDGVAGVRLIVDFMGPDSEATYLEDGTLQLEDSVATANTGVVLRPYPLSAAAIVEEDARSAEIENVALVYHPGVHADVTIRHIGPVGFLASKGDAFTTRSDDKDGYDVSWVCLNAGESPEGVAEWVMDCPAFENEYF